ncbi:hypothetical protein IQE94_05445 [Synechocystis sp. PCC 7339]|uniref:hypothetical protein n=1 Tax=Synechocystis sp. PCC 7339 TaxID=2782213 RepID=UPI001CBE60E1|nr:hypothetical protein [Synechocystis sp. PCC 7339]UAJ73726.1 hypothetical protein IQE94_05445 [Synechocystis sp. PCC 7339]
MTKKNVSPIVLSKFVEGIGEIQVSAFVYGFTWSNKTTKKIAKALFPDQSNVYHVDFYVEGFGDGKLFFVDNIDFAKIGTVNPWLKKEIKNNSNIFNALIDLVRININKGRIFK